MINVENLSKTFIVHQKYHGILSFFSGKKKKTLSVVKDISFHIGEGEIVGFIGKNGAGKSTTIKMLTGILTPSSGSVLVNGLVPHKERVKNGHNIGVVFGQKTQLWWDLPLIDSFVLLKKIYSIPECDFSNRLNLYINEFLLKDLLKKPVRTLSLGQRMRAEIAASLLHNPRVLFLDEPTIGLDIVAKKAFHKMIKRINEQFNTTILLTTHDISDIESTCGRLIIIDSGEKIFDGSISDLKKSIAFSKILSFELVEGIAPTNSCLAELGGFDRAHFLVDTNAMLVQIHFNDSLIDPIKMLKVVSGNFIFSSLTLSDEKMENVIESIYATGISHD